MNIEARKLRITKAFSSLKDIKQIARIALFYYPNPLWVIEKP
jgi:hypothetical protein